MSSTALGAVFPPFTRRPTSTSGAVKIDSVWKVRAFTALQMGETESEAANKPRQRGLRCEYGISLENMKRISYR